MRQFVLFLAIVAIIATGCSKSGVTPDKTNVGPPPADTTHNTKKDTVRIIINSDTSQMSAANFVVTSLQVEFMTYPEIFLPSDYRRNFKLGHYVFLFVGDTATHLLGHRLEILIGGAAYNRSEGPPSHDISFMPSNDFVYEQMGKQVIINIVAHGPQ